MRKVFLRFLPFWLFLIFFKFGGNIHYTALPALGEMLFPIWLAGLIVALESFLQMALDIPAGRLLDRLGYVRLLKWGTFFFMIAALFLIYGLTPATYLASVVVSVLGWLFFTPGVNAYLLAHARPGEAGRFFSIRDSSNAFGVILGAGSIPFVLLLPVPDIGALTLMVLFVAFAFLIFAPADKVPEQPLHQTHPYHVRRQSARGMLEALRRLNPASTMLLAYNVAGATFYAVIWFVVPIVIIQQEHTSGILGLGLAIFDCAIMVLGYVMGTLADKRDKRVLVFFGLLLFGGCGVIVGLTFTWIFILFGFLAAVGDEMAGVSLWAWLHSLDREHAADGSIAGILTFSEDFGWTIGPAIAGVLFGLVGPAGTIVLGAVPILLVWAYYYLRVHKHFPYEIVYDLLPHRPQERRHKS
jgi:MFS family permease